MNQIVHIVLWVTMQIRVRYGHSQIWMQTTYQRGARVVQLISKTVKCSARLIIEQKGIDSNYTLISTKLETKDSEIKKSSLENSREDFFLRVILEVYRHCCCVDWLLERIDPCSDHESHHEERYHVTTTSEVLTRWGEVLFHICIGKRYKVNID